MKNIRLKDIAIVTSGNSAPQNDKMFEDGIYPFVRTSDVGRVHLSASFTKPEDYLNETGIKGMKLFPKDSILFPKSGASTLLNHRVLLGEDSYVVSHLAVIVPDKSKVVPLYLYYYTTRIDAGELVNDRAYPSLKTSILEQVSLNLPSLAEQERIVTELDLLTGIIDKQKSQLKELDNLAQSIFYDMFGDPVQNERGWERKTISELCYPKRNVLRASKVFEASDIINYIDISSIDNKNNIMTSMSSMFFSEAPSRAQQVVANDDILISLVRPNLKNVAIVNQDADNLVASSGFCVLRHLPCITNEFLFYITKSKAFTEYLMQRVSGANYPAVREEDIKDYFTIVPFLEMQISFSQKIQAIESQKAAINRSIAETQKLFDYTMDKYFG